MLAGNGGGEMVAVTGLQRRHGDGHAQGSGAGQDRGAAGGLRLRLLRVVDVPPAFKNDREGEATGPGIGATQGRGRPSAFSFPSSLATRTEP